MAETIDVEGFSPGKYTPIRYNLYDDGKKCVFAQAWPTVGRTGSTLLIDDIVRVICARENLKKNQMRFFHLQPHNIHGGWGGAGENQFLFQEVRWNQQDGVTWTDAMCPPTMADDMELPGYRPIGTPRVFWDC